MRPQMAATVYVFVTLSWRAQKRQPPPFSAISVLILGRDAQRSRRYRLAVQLYVLLRGAVPREVDRHGALHQRFPLLRRSEYFHGPLDRLDELVRPILFENEAGAVSAGDIIDDGIGKASRRA